MSGAGGIAQSPKRLVVIESPYAGDIKGNLAYARACVRDSVLRGEAPIASHLLLTQDGILRDDVPEERALGIGAGLAWLRVADASAVYIDRGISNGMRQGIAAAEAAGVPVEYRSIGKAGQGAHRTYGQGDRVRATESVAEVAADDTGTVIARWDAPTVSVRWDKDGKIRRINRKRIEPTQGGQERA